MKDMNQKMGTHKFRISDIMPHSWFYKLKDISRSSKKHHPPSPKRLSSSEASSSRKLRNHLRSLSSTAHPKTSSPPKPSFKRRIKRKTLFKPSQRLKLSSASLHSHVSLTSSRDHRFKSASSAKAILDESFPSDQNYGICCDLESHSDIKDDHSVRKLDIGSEDLSITTNTSLVLVETVSEPPFRMRTQQKLNAGSSGIRIRTNSPKIARKKAIRRTPPKSKKKETAKSFAIVMSSVDPEKNFRESMVEMIVENKIREQKDLEDLLACYLSLNSSEYHDVIIKAFEKTWLHLTQFT